MWKSITKKITSRIRGGLKTTAWFCLYFRQCLLKAFNKLVVHKFRAKYDELVSIWSSTELKIRNDKALILQLTDRLRFYKLRDLTTKIGAAISNAEGANVATKYNYVFFSKMLLSILERYYAIRLSNCFHLWLSKNNRLKQTLKSLRILFVVLSGVRKRQIMSKFYTWHRYISSPILPVGRDSLVSDSSNVQKYSRTNQTIQALILKRDELMKRSIDVFEEVRDISNSKKSFVYKLCLLNQTQRYMKLQMRCFNAFRALVHKKKLFNISIKQIVNLTMDKNHKYLLRLYIAKWKKIIMLFKLFKLLHKQILSKGFSFFKRYVHIYIYIYYYYYII